MDGKPQTAVGQTKGYVGLVAAHTTVPLPLAQGKGFTRSSSNEVANENHFMSMFLFVYIHMQQTR